MKNWAYIVTIPNVGAISYARGFIGIVFRAADDGREFESFYIRPTNGKECKDPVRKKHGCQYFSFPGYTFSYFREFGITDYENCVDTIAINQWSRIKAVIRDDCGSFYVDGIKVLTIRELKRLIPFLIISDHPDCFISADTRPPARPSGEPHLPHPVHIRHPAISGTIPPLSRGLFPRRFRDNSSPRRQTWRQ